MNNIFGVLYRNFFIFTLVLSTMIGAPLAAQDYNKSAEDPPGKKVQDEPEPEPAITLADLEWLKGFRISGLIRFRPEFKYNYDFDKTTDDNKEYVGQKIKLNILKKFTDDVQAKISFQDARLWGGTPGSDTGINTANDYTDESVDVREAWFEAKNLLGPIGLKAGRQILSYGDQRLVGGLEWVNSGRSFDGLLLKFESDFFSSHLWGMNIAEEDNDSAGNSTAVGQSNSSGITYTCTSTGCTVTATVVNEIDDAYFTGWYNTLRFSDHFMMEVYYLGKHLKWKQATVAVAAIPNAEITTQDRIQDRDNLYTFGTRLTNRTQKNGKKAPTFFDWTVEYAYQTGFTGRYVNPKWDTAAPVIPLPAVYTSANNPCRTSYTSGGCRLYTEKQKYDAYAYAVDAGITLGDIFRVGGEYNVSSGDPDRTDGTVGTFNNLFHTNHKFYGQADLVSWRNINAKSVNLTITTKKWGKLRLAFWEVDKQELQDGWYAVTGALKANTTSESSANSKYGNSTNSDGSTSWGVGTLRKHLFKEFDVTYSIKAKGINWGVGYSQIIGGDSIQVVKEDILTAIANRKQKFAEKAQFGYLMMAYKF